MKLIRYIEVIFIAANIIHSISNWFPSKSAFAVGNSTFFFIDLIHFYGDVYFSDCQNRSGAQTNEIEGNNFKNAIISEKSEWNAARLNYMESLIQKLSEFHQAINLIFIQFTD